MTVVNDSISLLFFSHRQYYIINLMSSILFFNKDFYLKLLEQKKNPGRKPVNIFFLILQHIIQLFCYKRLINYIASYTKHSWDLVNNMEKHLFRYIDVIGFT